MYGKRKQLDLRIFLIFYCKIVILETTLYLNSEGLNLINHGNRVLFFVWENRVTYIWLRNLDLHIFNLALFSEASGCEKIREWCGADRLHFNQ